jgi:hypothetical protein
MFAPTLNYDVMEQTENKTGSMRPTREQLKEIMDQYDEQQGLPIKEFCKLHGISEGSFYSYRRRKQLSIGKTTGESSGFIAIHPSVPGSPAGLFAEVRGIKIYQMVPAEYLKALES